MSELEEAAKRRRTNLHPLAHEGCDYTDHQLSFPQQLVNEQLMAAVLEESVGFSTVCVR